VEVVDGLGPIDGEELLRSLLDLPLHFDERFVVRWDGRHVQPVREVARDRCWEDEVSIGDALHQGRGPEPVRSVIREVRLARSEEARDRRLEVVVDPEATHRVVGSGIDPHGRLVRILVGDPLVHLEQVPVPVLDRLASETADRIFEVQVDPVLERTDAVAFFDQAHRRPGGDVAGDQVPERRVLTFEVVVAVLFGNVPRCTGLLRRLRYRTSDGSV